MIALEHRGFKVWCDGYRASNHHLVFLSLFGPQSAVRALWADAVGEKRPAITIGDKYLSLESEKYTSIRSMLDEHNLHLVVVHPQATSLVSPFAKMFVVLSENPAEQYWPRFSRMCSVPMRQTWRESVWRIGTERKLITSLEGIGPVQAYRIETNTEKWATAIRESIAAKELV